MEPSDQKPLKSFDRKIKGIAFDLDNTLYSRTDAFTSWLQSLGIRDFTEIISRDQDGYCDKLTFFSWLTQHLGLESTGQELWDRFVLELPNHVSPQNFNLVTLQELKKRGYQIALLSNGGAPLQRAKLEATGLAGIFGSNRILLSGELGRKKPDEWVFQELASRMNLSPSEIIFVGDHLENDIDGAHRAGMVSAWMRNNHPLPDNLREETLVIEDLSDLLAHFHGHERN